MNWLRTGDVAQLFGWSRRKVRRMCEEGRHFKNAEWDGKQWRIPSEDVDTYRAFRKRITERARRIASDRRDKGDAKSP